MVKLLDEREIEDRSLEYEDRLRKEMGLETKKVRHFQRPAERPFTKDQKESTTILWGSLTLAHEHLLSEAMRRLGYNIRHLPTPDNEALALGKELGSRGQCNPTYYTVGNLIKYLKQLRDQGEEDIEERYVCVTAGGCGPCRFGMYEAEYRKALRDAGFGNFRVLLFQQTGGMNQNGKDAALQINARFAQALLQAFMLGDVINDLGYQIRPYEVIQGETDRVIEEAKIALGDALREGRAAWRVLRRLKKRFAAIQVDYTRVKPKVKIIGEFWAQTTEGDGNYKIFRWLESEGAEVAVEPIATWIEYLIHIAKQNAEEKLLLDKSKKQLVRKIKLLQLAFRWWYNLYRWSLGFKTESLPSQRRLAEYAQAYYNTHLRGGEGHLEVGKNVMVAKERHAHMVISLKPFGCMPSTMSDGVQSKVVADYKGAIYIPIETSGDGEVNVKSRVQMKLFEAKVRAREELAEVLSANNMTLDQVRDYAGKHPGRTNPMRRLPGHHWTGTTARFVASASRRRMMPLRWLGLARRNRSQTQNP
jgi:predicted nucleotide-binding protein (sugar kinase/HSP70/actin superfamily)